MLVWLYFQKIFRIIIFFEVRFTMIKWYLSTVAFDLELESHWFYFISSFFSPHFLFQVVFVNIKLFPRKTLKSKVILHIYSYTLINCWFRIPISKYFKLFNTTVCVIYITFIFHNLSVLKYEHFMRLLEDRNYEKSLKVSELDSVSHWGGG